jgi:hypothetical protein
MTVKLLLLKSSEDIIANVSEMTVGEDNNRRVVGYYLEKPCIIRISNESVISEDDSEKKAQVGISLYPWIPLTKDTVIPIVADWVITMINPVDNLEEMYIKDVLKNGKNNQDIDTTEQSNIDQSN